MHRILVFLSLVSVSLAVRCYSSQNTVPGPSSQIVVVDCPSAQFCFKSYIARNTRGDNSYTETRTCGNVGTCYETGCKGTGDNEQCCCVGDLCNSAPHSPFTNALLISVVLPVIYRLF